MLVTADCVVTADCAVRRLYDAVEIVDCLVIVASDSSGCDALFLSRPGLFIMIIF